MPVHVPAFAPVQQLSGAPEAVQNALAPEEADVKLTVSAPVELAYDVTVPLICTASSVVDTKVKGSPVVSQERPVGTVRVWGPVWKLRLVVDWVPGVLILLVPHALDMVELPSL